MGVEYYAKVPKFKLLFYIGRNIPSYLKEDAEEIYNDLINDEDYGCPTYKTLKDLSLTDIKEIVSLAELSLKTLIHKYSMFLLLYLKWLDIDYEIISDSDEEFNELVDNEGYTVFDNV